MVVALSPRELQVVALLADGLVCKEVAARLDLSVQTVKNYAHRARLKLGARTTPELTAMFRSTTTVPIGVAEPVGNLSKGEPTR